MYISLQSPDLIFDQLNKLSMNLSLCGVTVTIFDLNGPETLYLKDLSDLTQYGKGYHLDVISNLSDQLHLKIVKDLNRVPNYQSTFSTLLLQTSQMKHLDCSNSTNKTEVDEFKVN